MDTQNQGEQYYQKQKSLSQFIKSQFLRKAVTKLIVSVSVFSLFFSHTTLISFLHYFKFYFSTLPFKLFSHTLDKNCTFLLCNGLLVFLAKYSGLFSESSSPSSNNNKSNLTVDHHESFKNYEDVSQPQLTIMETTAVEVPTTVEQEAELESTQTQQKQNATQQENETIESEAAITKTETEETLEEQEKEEAEEESAVLEEEKEEAEEESAVPEEDKEEEAEAESSFFIEDVEEEEEEEEEEGNGKLSDEELNKKFEDFIRKMKEELRIEARQQLIMV